MTALAASGRRYEALAMFDRLREALAEEYAADPEPATRRLYRDLLTHGGAELDPVPAGEVAATEGAVTRMPTPEFRSRWACGSVNLAAEQGE